MGVSLTQGGAKIKGGENKRERNIKGANFDGNKVYGGYGPECLAFHKHLATKIADKTGDDYAQVLTFMRCKISFIIFRAALLCLRGSVTTASNDFTLDCYDAKL